MKRLRGAIVVLLACSCLAGAADLPERWRSWRYSRSISTPVAASHDTGELRLPWEVLGHSSTGGADIRVIDSSGLEVPFELWTSAAAPDTRSHSANLLENSFVEGKYTQVVADLGAQPEIYDHVTLETPESDFVIWAEVALSDDAKTWRVVEPRGPLARLRSRSIDGTQTIAYVGVASRYARVRIFKKEAQFPVSGLTFSYQVRPPLELAEIPATFKPVSAPEGESAWTTVLASSSLPVSRVQFATGTGEFYRAVRISESDDGKQWNDRGSGAIYRYTLAGKKHESLTVEFPEWRQGLLLRVSIIDLNDRPLADVSVKLLGVPRRIYLKAKPGQAYRLLYGNENASAPQYDLSHYFEASPQKVVSALLTLGPEEPTSNFRDPRPFSEQHPSFIWIAFALAAIFIGTTALRALRPRTPRPPAG